MKLRHLVTIPLFFAAGTLPSLLSGQNTSTVFSPDVKAGSQALEFRFGYDPDADSLAKRLHYQYAFNDAFRLRGIVLYRSDETEDWDYRYYRLEAQYQFLEDDTAPFDSALRFEFQYADGDDRPSRVRLAWTSKMDLNEDWQIRKNILTGHQFGPESTGGYLLETRAQVTRKLNDRFKLGVDYYGDLNDTNDFGSFDEQEHQLGPILKFDATDRLSGFAGVLYGISDSAADVEYRLILTYDI